MNYNDWHLDGLMRFQIAERYGKKDIGSYVYKVFLASEHYGLLVKELKYQIVSDSFESYII